MENTAHDLIATMWAQLLCSNTVCLTAEPRRNYYWNSTSFANPNPKNSKPLISQGIKISLTPQNVLSEGHQGQCKNMHQTLHITLHLTASLSPLGPPEPPRDCFCSVGTFV
jgi:hypothetical protein